MYLFKEKDIVFKRCLSTEKRLKAGTKVLKQLSEFSFRRWQSCFDETRLDNCWQFTIDIFTIMKILNDFTDVEEGIIRTF
jgi:hypothetical protein